jgi:ATP phosphoribosyltransferase
MNGGLLIALPKGRLFDAALEILARANIRMPDVRNGSRRLTFPDTESKYDFVALKPVDIPVYVESGAIDAGIVGSDVLRENEPDVYEPLDLQIGKCRMVVAAPKGSPLDFGSLIRIATKYPSTAERHFLSKHVHVRIVRLEGSVEIAPLLGLSHGIVDLVETGRTLRENGMEVIDEVAPVSAKLIVNRTAMKTKSVTINKLIHQLDTAVYADT